MAAARLDALLQQLGSRIAQAETLDGQVLGENAPLVLGWPELDAALPDGGLPRGVVELTCPRALGGATSIALCAVRAAHARDARAWCAWIDPEGTLHAPGMAMAGVDLARLLVVRSPRADLGRISVKVAAARAFDVIVIDMDAIHGAPPLPRASPKKRGPGRAAVLPEVLVRKLALLAIEGGARILLLTDANAKRGAPWPVALRLELSRTPDALALRVAKERRGRVGLVKTVPLRTRPLGDGNSKASPERGQMQGAG